MKKVVYTESMPHLMLVLSVTECFSFNQLSNKRYRSWAPLGNNTQHWQRVSFVIIRLNDHPSSPVHLGSIRVIFSVII